MTSVNIGIVGYGMGNIASLYNAFTALQVPVFIAEKPSQLREATHMVLPGVGAFPNGMEHLQSLGFEEALRKLVLEDRRPLLGICLGMQLLATVGEEHRVCPGLGFIPGRVTLLKAPGQRIPHMGWNDTVSLQADTLLRASGATGCFYYVHSFHLIPDDPAHTSMSCTHGELFTAAVQHGNIFGVQFHPEKSHGDGLSILKRFTEVSSVETSAHPVSFFAERIDRPKPAIP